MFKKILVNLPENLVEVFNGDNLRWHALAAALTFALVTSGADWRYFETTRGAFLQELGLPAAIVGFFVPIILPVGLYIFGELKKDEKIMNAASAVAQAIFIALLVSAIYKSFTGRIQPEFLTHLSSVDASRDFNFGFLRHGIFWGWPSSHAAAAFAEAVSLAMLYPRKKFMRYAAIIYALYIGFGVSISIHWLSDSLAGAILGALIGAVVARNFFSHVGS